MKEKKQKDLCSLLRYGLDTFSDSVSPVLQIQLIDCCLQASGPVRFESSRSLNALAWFFAMTTPCSPFKDFLIKGFEDICMGSSQRIDWGVLRQVFCLDPELDDLVFDEHDWFLSSNMKELLNECFSDYSLSQLEVADRRLGCMEVVLNTVREQIRANPNNDSVSDVISGFESVDAFFKIDCYWRFIKSLAHYGVGAKLAEIDDVQLVDEVKRVPSHCHEGMFMTKSSNVSPASKDSEPSEQGVSSSVRRGPSRKE